MSSYDERFKASEVHKNMESVINKLESIISDSSNPDVLEHLDRLLKVTIYTKIKLANLIAPYIPESVIININNSLANIINTTTNYESSKELAQLVNANAHADNLLIQLQSLPGIETTGDITTFSESLFKLNESINNILISLNEKRTQSEDASNLLLDR